MRLKSFVAVMSMIFGVATSAEAGDLLVSTDKYMADKTARISEIKQMCRQKIQQVALSGGQQAMYFVCAFDTAHTTGFNALTQDNKKLVDLTKIQTEDYTFEMMAVIHSAVKDCRRQFDGGKGSADADSVAYCVAMRGYAYGKKYAKRYLDGSPM